MHNASKKMISFESERSLGPAGDALFLDIRHRILTAQFGPRQRLDPAKLAVRSGVSASVAASVAQALADHGYLVPDNDGELRVVYWTSAAFADLIGACHDLIGLAIGKCMDRIDAIGLAHLSEALTFELVDPISAAQIEAFQIRWWIFFHTIISTIEVRNFRKMMLTDMPPALRRRVITSLDGVGLRSMLADMTALIGAFANRDAAQGQALLVHQFASFTPPVIAANECYNRYARDDEVDYGTSSLLDHPLFRDVDSPLPPFGPGMREPLSWDEFKAISLEP
jgi:DNA-binding GntR family transcriptional regulator